MTSRLANRHNVAPEPLKIRIKKNDVVKVIAGRDKGKTGRVLEVDRVAGRVLVEGVMLSKKHVKPNPAKGVKAPAGDPKRADYATKAAVVAFVKKSFADGADLIKSKGDGGLGDLYVDPFSNGQTRFSDGAWAFIEHSGEHYGQLVVYYRVAGLVPPESRPKK